MTAIRTIIVVPCYNEAQRLDADAFHQYILARPDMALLFVDDGSTDATGEILGQLIARCSERLWVHTLEQNSGKAQAVRAGFLKAFESDPVYVGFWDADLATPLADIDVFVALLEECPNRVAVFGSRVNLLGREVHRNLMRHYVGRVFATLAAMMLRLPIYDTQCGAKMFRVTNEVRNAFTEPFRSRWIFDVEIIARLRAAWPTTERGSFGNALYEHPLMKWTDVAGSKLRMRDFLIVSRDLLRIRSHHRSAIRAQAAAERAQA